MKKILQILLLLVFNISFVVAQNDSLNIYQQDFIYLTQLLEDTHPNIYENIDKEELEKCKKITLQKLQSIDKNVDFQIYAQKYVSKLKDAHTKIFFGQMTNDFKYPLQIYYVKNKIFISNLDKTLPKDWLGAEILSFNNIPIDTVINRASEYFSCENRYCYLENIVKALNDYQFLKLIEVISDNKILQLKVKQLNSKIETIEFTQLSKNKFKQLPENKLTGFSNNLFHYKILNDKNTCYFHYQECRDLQYLKANKKRYKPMYFVYYVAWWIRGGNFSKFLKKMFHDVEKDNIQNLVIDVRQNRGGSSILNEQLLEYITSSSKVKDYSESVKLSNLLKQRHPKYFNDIYTEYREKHLLDTIKLPFLIKENDKIFTNSSNECRNEYLTSLQSPYYMQEPKYKFTGNIYILTSPKTFSSAAMLAIKLRDNNIAVTVGMPTGQKPTQFGEALWFTLPLTHTRGIVSCKKFYRPDRSKDKELSLYPDIELWYNIKDIIYGTDTVFDKLFDEIIK